MKKLILRLLAKCGYELRRSDERASLAGSLGNLARLGLRPASVLDVGAAYGDFTRLCAGLFPEAALVMVEPLAEYRPWLDALCAELPQARLVAAAAAAQQGTLAINVHPDLVGSSLFAEDEDSDVNGQARMVPTIALDELVATGPYLLKIDAQGAEEQILSGAADLLKDCAAVVLEVSFFEFFKGAPLATQLITGMEAKGFALYDIFGLAHRPLDGALAQADMVFVKSDGTFRHHHRYATVQQRKLLTERLRTRLRREPPNS